MYINHYQLLGVEPDAPKGQAKIVYRSLVRLVHPDCAPNDLKSPAHHVFTLISEAYEEISNMDNLQIEIEATPEETPLYENYIPGEDDVPVEYDQEEAAHILLNALEEAFLVAKDLTLEVYPEEYKYIIEYSARRLLDRGRYILTQYIEEYGITKMRPLLRMATWAPLGYAIPEDYDVSLWICEFAAENIESAYI